MIVYLASCCEILTLGLRSTALYLQKRACKYKPKKTKQKYFKKTSLKRRAEKITPERRARSDLATGRNEELVICSNFITSIFKQVIFKIGFQKRIFKGLFFGAGFWERSKRSIF
ncbi:hypothetical protein CDIK_3319 [Cucumispora dikerogammari]|nr:hypothetical protein CDIK_3319 [Cucumispora dikerogammari]